MTLTSEMEAEAPPLATRIEHIEGGTAKLEPLAVGLPDPVSPVLLPDPALQPARRQKHAILPIAILAIAILATISWNALLLWQFVKGVMFVLHYAFS